MLTIPARIDVRLITKQTIILVALFLIFFATKLYHRVDIPLLVMVPFCLFAFTKAGTIKFEKSLSPYFLSLAFFCVYSGLVMTLYEFQEIVFFLKFSRTFLMFFLLYITWGIISPILAYETFLKYFVLMVVLHSIVVICCVTFPWVRDSIYPITGYVPRGPAWSRSPGITFSYNSTVILHVLGLWLLITRKHWPLMIRIAFIAATLISFVYMGRTVVMAGMLLIVIYLAFLLKRVLLVSLLSSASIIVFCLFYYGVVNTSFFGPQVSSSLHHFAAPIMSSSEGIGAVSYLGDTMVNHIYFSNDLSTILFGNSLAGHVGILNPTGETNSDIGFINSINANGLIVTSLIYCFYASLIWGSRKKDWITVSIVAFLSLALSFKETGLFASHATQVLFFLFFYNYFPNPRGPTSFQSETVLEKATS